MKPIIDTLQIAKQFEAVGFDRNQAEVFAETFRKYEKAIIHEVRERDDSYSTKGDAKEIASSLKLEIKDTEICLIKHIYALHLGGIAFILGGVAKMMGKW